MIEPAGCRPDGQASRLLLRRPCGRVRGESGRILVGDLQAEATGLFEIGPELSGPAPFSLPVLVPLFDPRLMEPLDDGMKVFIGDVKSIVTSTIGRFRDLA